MPGGRAGEGQASRTVLVVIGGAMVPTRLLVICVFVYTIFNQPSFWEPLCCCLVLAGRALSSVEVVVNCRQVWRAALCEKK